MLLQLEHGHSLCSTHLLAEQLQQVAVVQRHASDAELKGLAALQEELAAASTTVDMLEAAAVALAGAVADGPAAAVANGPAGAVADGPAGPAGAVAVEAAMDTLQALAGSEEL